MSITTCELFWLRMLFKELGVPLPVAPVIWCDNISVLALASNPVFHARIKHIEVDYHFVREKVVNRHILIKFISTNDQIVNIFTKGLTTARFNFLKSKLMIEPPPISLRGDVSDTYAINANHAAAKSDTYAITDNYAAATKNDTYEINADQVAYSRNHTVGIIADHAAYHAASGKENIGGI
jgi:hypothetical protein